MPDENDIDAGWDSEPETETETETEPEPERPEPTPTPDIEALDDGWDAPRRHRTGAERAAARKEKARTRAARQKERAADAQSRQKRKKPRSPQPKTKAEAKRKPIDKPMVSAALAFSPRRTKRSWTRMLVAVALIVVVAAFVLFVIVR